MSVNGSGEEAGWRRLVMAAAVDEQIEVQLPFHRAAP
jgi:hypothetical protein